MSENENLENIELTQSDNDSEKEIAGESKADKFKRIGAGRVNKALVAISRLGALSGNAYEYTDEQVESMFGALQAALDAEKAKFAPKEKKDVATFSF